MLKKVKTTRESSNGKRIMQQIYNLRKEVYQQIGWMTQHESHLIRDNFDEIPQTTHFALLENGEVIGAHRMTRYSNQYKLPYITEGYEPIMFKTSSGSISEASRYLLRQDRRYPGGAKQLLFNTLFYELTNNSSQVVSIGNPEHTGFFEHIGFQVVNKEVDVVIDSHQNKQVILKGVPLVAEKSTLNYDLELDRYNERREFVVIRDNQNWREFWDQFSEKAYDYTNLLPEYKKMLIEVERLVGKNKKVLDAGCGTGNLTKRLAKQNQVSAIDFSPAMVAIAKTKLKEFKKSNISLGDVTELKFKDEVFDAVVSVNVLYNLDDPKKAIMEMARVVKKNGILIVSTPASNVAFDSEIIEKVYADTKKANNDHISELLSFNKMLFDQGGMKFKATDDHIKKLLNESGFEVQMLKTIYYGRNHLIYAMKR